jgi:hypothetical protein
MAAHGKVSEEMRQLNLARGDLHEAIGALRYAHQWSEGQYQNNMAQLMNALDRYIDAKIAPLRF